MNPAADVWAKVISLMQPDMTATTINTWFDDATAVALEDDRFVLYSPTRFKRDIIATRYVSKIQTALRDLFSCDMEVTVLRSFSFSISFLLSSGIWSFTCSKRSLIFLFSSFITCQR